MGTARRIPRRLALQSQKKICHVPRWMEMIPFAFNKSNAASNTHMNEVWPALVPIVWTILFSRALVFEARRIRTKAMKPKKAETTDRLGPKPNFKTQYG